MQSCPALTPKRPELPAVLGGKAEVGGAERTRKEQEAALDRIEQGAGLFVLHPWDSAQLLTPSQGSGDEASNGHTQSR